MAAWFILGKLKPGSMKFAPRNIHPGTLIGGALFGTGWAISGGCPTIALAQIGEGQLVHRRVSNRGSQPSGDPRARADPTQAVCRCAHTSRESDHG